MSGLLAGLGATVIGGIGSLFSQHSQNKFNAQQAALNRQFIADENAKAFDRNWNQMLYQNDYNSPANQRKLYEQAGINYQNIVGGTGGTSVSKSGNAASPSGGASTPAAAPLQMEWANNIANIGLIKAQTEKTKAEANAIDSTTEGHVKSLDLVNQWQEQTNKILDKYGMKSAYLDNELKETQSIVNTMQEGLIRIEKMLKEGELNFIQPKQAANIAADTALKAAQAANLDENTKLTKQEREQREKDFALRCAVLGSTVAKAYSEVKLNSQLGFESDSRTLLNRGSASIQNIEFNQRMRYYQECYDDYLKQVRTGLKLNNINNKNLINSSWLRSPDNWMSPVWRAIDYGKGLMPTTVFPLK